MKKKCKLLNLSIRNTFILTFIITLLISVAAICVLLLVNWSSSAKDMTRNLSTHMVTEVYNNIETIVYQPKHINEINHKIISDGILDVNNETERERFFVSILRSHDEVVYSVAYATKDGEYYGARRNASGEIEIMRNDVSTGGHSWYYAVNADGTAGERAEDAGVFDPRTRPWYQAVAEAQAPAFSPIYKHFVMDDLTVSAGWPIYHNGVLDGVFVTHSLLTGIGTQIKSLVEVNDGFAIIFEKNGGAMVANSLELENFSVEEGVLQRKTIQDYKDLNDAYQFYIAENDNQFFDFYQQKRVNYSVEEYQNDGVEWIVLCGVPEDKLMMSVYHNIYITLAIVVTSLLAAFFVFSLLSKRFMKPLDQLAKTAEKFSSGNFSDRVQVARNDELGKIAKVFNQMAESTQYHISNLEVTVEKRTKDLKDSRERLRLLLDSAAEGIYGIDNKNICTFCNKSCLRLLGYHKSEELIGKEMHSKIHHKKADGSNYQEKDCIILKAIQKGQGIHVDDEVFWRADGTYFYVEYHAYPQIVDGKIVGGVVTFSDITERKKREEKINYLSFHDTLTGLLNRGGYEKEVKVADTAENLP
ncbi:MAG: PAS domain S-box protein, partial [Clostridia bacterium]|nr:PAS domain S-box protein [Clostridia bacterium]